MASAASPTATSQVTACFDFSVRRSASARNSARAAKPAVYPSDIKKKIEDALARHAEIEAREIRVTVREGKVSLEGKVDSWEERRAVEDAAWSVVGVQSVDDRLTIVH